MPIRLRPIDTQVVVIIGATSGIGRETALRFAERGARLVVTARDELVLQDLPAELLERGAQGVETVTGDIADATHAPAVVQRALARYGRIDTWAQIAGVDIFARFEDTDPTEFQRVVAVNLLGTAYAAKAALPALRAAGQGAFIAVTSVEADVPLPYQSAYSASKHGVSALLRTIRMELEREGAPIAITQIQPYGIDTPLFRVSLSRMPGAPKPAAPIYDPAVVAELIVHAAEHPSRELFAGGAGWMTAMFQRYAPRVSEATLGRLTERMTSTPEGEPATGTGNLFQPVVGTDQIRGGYGGRSFSVANRLQMLPPAARLMAVTALGALTMVALRRRHA